MKANNQPVNTPFIQKPLISVVLILFAFAILGCEDNRRTVQDGYHLLEVGDQTIRAELAVTPAQRQKGLMHRRTLAVDTGMLFIFTAPKQQSFWMKNTYIALDIAYIDTEGVIREIHPLFPHSIDSVPSRTDDIQYALEVNRDWFKNNGVSVGDRINLEGLPDPL